MADNIINEINKAFQLSKSGEFSSAIKIYNNILETDKDNIFALSCLGLLYLELCQYPKSYELLLRANSIKPSTAVTEGLALSCFFMDKSRSAYEYFNKIIDITKNFLVLEKYVELLLKLNKNSTAYVYAKKFYENYPFRKELAVNYAKASLYSGQFSQAVKSANDAVVKFPEYGEAYKVQGLVYEVVFHDYEEAAKLYKKELRYGSKDDAYFNLALCYERLNDYKKTLYYVNKLAKIVGEYDHSVTFIKASVYFKMRKFNLAYKYFQYRGWSGGKRIINLKNIWDGKNYKDETLFVLGDNGIGDIVMYSRYLPYLASKFKKIKVYIREDMKSLIQRFCKGYKNIVFVKKTKRYPLYDKSIHLSDLPYCFRKKMKNIPDSEGYLFSDERNNKKYDKYFDNDKLKVGICWEAGTVGIRDLLHRTLNVSMFGNLFENKKVQFYALQVNPSMDNYKDYPSLIDLGSTFKTGDDTVSAISHLDLIITVDTSVAHMAGAMGKKTFLLLPYCADWRWFDNDKTTEWYDSVKIFKQTNPQNWDDVFERIKSELEI